MAKREYSFYPGCSSQKGASSSNYLVSVNTMCEELDIQLNTIPDWNCCAASIGTTPTCSPSAPIKRTSCAVMSSFRRVFFS